MLAPKPKRLVAGRATRAVSGQPYDRSSLLLPISRHQNTAHGRWSPHPRPPLFPRPFSRHTPPSLSTLSPSTASLRHHHPPSTLDQRPPNCPLERLEAPGPQATRLVMGNVGSRLDDGSPLYLKDQTRCKRQEATACMVACARVFADPPRQSSFRLFISPTPEAKHCYASLPTHSPRLGILHTKMLETTPRWSTCR